MSTETQKVGVLPGARAPFELSEPFTTEELVGLADKLRGRRRAAILAYANTLQRETYVAELIAAAREVEADAAVLGMSTTRLTTALARVGGA